jgi:hypothetical protein
MQYRGAKSCFIKQAVTLFVGFTGAAQGIYYDALTRVRISNDLAHWVKFFLTAVIETAERGQRTFQSILALRNELGSKMVTLG